MAEISILVPVYNTERYLVKCMESIINQTLKDIEIICINDGSKDNSAQILQNYARKDDRIKVINKENTGYGHSMNLGIEKAAGRYIGIVEPDDYIKNTMFEDLYNIAEKFNADIVKSEFYNYGAGNNFRLKTNKLMSCKYNRIINIYSCPHIVRVQPSIWSSIYNSRFLKSKNIRFLETEGASYQDTSFSFKSLCLSKRTVFTPNAYYYYRKDNENSSVNSPDKIFSVCTEFEEINNFLNKNADIKKIVNTQKLIAEYGTYRWNIMRIDEKFRSTFLDKFSNIFKTYYENGEIESTFYKKYKQKELLLLINNKNEFRRYMESYILKTQKKEQRRKSFSIHLNPSRCSVILFGRQII